MEKGGFIRITPFIHVPDIAAAVSFFESLGFTTYFRFEDYAYVQARNGGRALAAEPWR
jgi:predicted lactoylglutathione lyase